jgi:S1-C subfamily serine protease
MSEKNNSESETNINLSSPQDISNQDSDNSKLNIEKNNLQYFEVSATKQNLSQPVNNNQKNIGKIPLSKKTSRNNLLIYIITFLVSFLVVLIVLITLVILFYDGKNFKDSSSATLTINSTSKTVERDNLSGPFSFTPNLNSKSVEQIVEEALPSVLSIRVKTVGSNRSGSSEVAGTGYFVSEDGLVITNRHVISSICDEVAYNGGLITALTHSQKAYELELLTVDPIDDLAILKIKNSNDTFQKVNFADPLSVKQGADTIAIGNVFGQFNNTVTKGIISGLNRTLDTNLTDECTGNQISADGLIQTDAAINQGNSGGPLFDAGGNVVGMNTFGSSDGQNVGFAIPSNTIITALNSYTNFGKIIRPRLGIVSSPIDAAVKVQNSWLPSDYGELISVVSGSADRSGLKEGDIILEVDGKRLESVDNNPSPLRREILNRTAGSEIELTILKSTAKESKINESTYRYEASSTKIKVMLGEVSFDLKSKFLN